MDSDNTDNPKGAEPEGFRAKVAGAIEFIRTVVYAVIIAVGIRTFAYEPFSIPSGSMIPTLLVGDYLFVSKFSYGYSRHSLPFSLPLFEGRIFGSPPKRGDVAVFKFPDPSDRNYGKDYIKENCRSAGRPRPSSRRRIAYQWRAGAAAEDRRV